MSNGDVSDRLKHMEQDLEDKKRERSELVDIYEKEKKLVTRCGLAAIICILFHKTLLQWMADNKNHASLKAIGMYLQPIVFMVFLILAVVVIARGFDFFINSRLEYGRRLAEKLKRKPLSDEIDELSKAIIFLEEESGKIQEEIINQREEDKLQGGHQKNLQYESVKKTEDEWAALFHMDDEEDDEEDEGSSDEMWKKDVLHL